MSKQENSLLITFNYEAVVSRTVCPDEFEMNIFIGGNLVKVTKTGKQVTFRLKDRLMGTIQIPEEL